MKAKKHKCIRLLATAAAGLTLASCGGGGGGSSSASGDSYDDSGSYDNSGSADSSSGSSNSSVSTIINPDIAPTSLAGMRFLINDGAFPYTFYFTNSSKLSQIATGGGVTNGTYTYTRTSNTTGTLQFELGGSTGRNLKTVSPHLKVTFSKSPLGNNLTGTMKGTVIEDIGFPNVPPVSTTFNKTFTKQ